MQRNGGKMTGQGDTTDAAEKGVPEDQAERQARADGRDRVRLHLLAALDGLGPRRGQTVEALKAEQAAVAERLCYMGETPLRALAECALRMAGALKQGAKGAPAFPEPAKIYAWAFVLQFPPPRSSDYVPSLMRSRLGDEAMDGGWHVELFRAARRGPPPPNDYIKARLRDEADENRRLLRRIVERVEADQASPDDRRYLAAWHRDKAEAEALVADGRAHRAAASKGAGADRGAA